jgi:DsbC/DsbD-like thiol-disulfide interchange protein
MVRARLMPIWTLLLALLLAPAALAQVAPVPHPIAPPTHIAAELAAEDAAVPGEQVMLALSFRPDAGWHGYWSNPGDAGYGMRLDWTLPDGWSVGEPLYPVPQRLRIGGLMNHVYEGPYAVLVPLNVAPGSTGIAPIAVRADWLACTDQICVPEGATLTLRLAVSGSGLPAPQRDTRFDGWRAVLPPLLDQPTRFQLTPALLRVAIPLPADAPVGQPHLFLKTERVVDYGAEQRFWRNGDLLVAEIPRAGPTAAVPAIDGILTLANGRGIRFAGVPGAVPAGGERVGEAGAASALRACPGRYPPAVNGWGRRARRLRRSGRCWAVRCWAG